MPQTGGPSKKKKGSIVKKGIKVLKSGELPKGSRKILTKKYKYR